MKKKIFVLLMSLAMVMTMMPLSVFAGTQNAQVRTDLGNTGLYLLGDRPALPGEDQDFVVHEEDDYISLRTDGWTIGGQNSDFALVCYPRTQTEQFHFTMENGLHINTFEAENEDMFLDITGDVTVEDYVATAGRINFIGIGSLTIVDGYIVSGGGEMNGSQIVIDGPTINLNIEKNGVIPCAFLAMGDLDFKSGKLIISNNKPQTGEEETVGLVCGGQVNLGENAELFVKDNNAAIAVKDVGSLLEKNIKGDAEAKPYEERETVQSNLSVTEIPFLGEDFQTFAIAGTNETLAKTVYCSNGVEPTPNPPVNPTDTGNGAQGGVSTGASAMPIICITLGFAAAVVGFYGLRRLRDR